MQWVAHDAVMPINLFGSGWDRPFPPPRVLGVARLSDKCTGVNVDGVFYERLLLTPDGPWESVAEMVLRVADDFRADAPYELSYDS